jgi:Rrf2 family protein
MLFALEAIVDIAYNARPHPVQSKEITRRQGIPQRYLEQVMQQLVHAGILKSIRGPRGGYTLARERRRISIGEIVRTVADMDPETEELPPGSALAVQVVRPLWDSLCDEMWQRLDTVTIDDLCQRARTLRIGVDSKERADFAI